MTLTRMTMRRKKKMAKTENFNQVAVLSQSEIDRRMGKLNRA